MIDLASSDWSLTVCWPMLQFSAPGAPVVAKPLEKYALCLRAIDRSKEAERLESRAKAIRARSSN
jgi:hypothetical protein